MKRRSVSGLCAVKPAWSRVGIVALILFAGYSGADDFSTDEALWQERSPWIGAIEELPRGVLTKDQLEELNNIGEALFSAKFTVNDGAGRPGATQAIIPTIARHRAQQNFARTSGPDASACVSCHNDPAPGGAGDFVTTVFVSEGFSNADFNTTDPQFSNERGTNHLFGAGLIELLAREMTADLTSIRANALHSARASGVEVRAALESKGVSFGAITAYADGLVELDGVQGVDTDLVIRPFSQKGVMTSLRQFTINALNHHHGMQATERFGSRWTGNSDFDDDGYRDELGAADVSALVAWQAMLPAPLALQPSTDNWAQAAKLGHQQFVALGCDSCHRSSLPLKSLAFSDPGQYDVAGTLNTTQVAQAAVYDLALLDWADTLPRAENGDVLVPLFGDLKRHRMTDRGVEALGNELLSQRFVDRTFFMTAELWGVASTAPYGHRNDFTTLDEIIRAHGGDSRSARDAYVNATESEQLSLRAYLKTLVITP